MEEQQIRFDNGANYEGFMGGWSQLAGEKFLKWLDPAPELNWLDVGCGNGAFTELIFERCDPNSVTGIDPSPEQIEFARSRAGIVNARLQVADAMELPFQDGTFNAAVMPLVIFFVPEPPRGVQEMARVVTPSGSISAYAWDMPGDGFPYAAINAELRAMGIHGPQPPFPEVSSLTELEKLWSNAGLSEVETTAIEVSRTFGSLDEYWETAKLAPSFGPKLGELDPGSIERLRQAVVERFPADESGRINVTARANAVKGIR